MKTIDITEVCDVFSTENGDRNHFTDNPNTVWGFIYNRCLDLNPETIDEKITRQFRDDLTNVLQRAFTYNPPLAIESFQVNANYGFDESPASDTVETFFYARVEFDKFFIALTYNSTMESDDGPTVQIQIK